MSGFQLQRLIAAVAGPGRQWAGSTSVPATGINRTPAKLNEPLFHAGTFKNNPGCCQ